MFTNPQWLVRLDAARRALSRHIPRINFDKVRSFAFALVFEHLLERSPRRSRPTVSLEICVALSHDLPLSLPIHGTVFFPRKVTLCPFQSLAFVT